MPSYTWEKGSLAEEWHLRTPMFTLTIVPTRRVMTRHRHPPGTWLVRCHPDLVFRDETVLPTCTPDRDPRGPIEEADADVAKGEALALLRACIWAQRGLLARYAETLGLPPDDPSRAAAGPERAASTPAPAPIFEPRGATRLAIADLAVLHLPGFAATDVEQLCTAVAGGASLFMPNADKDALLIHRSDGDVWIRAMVRTASYTSIVPGATRPSLTSVELPLDPAAWWGLVILPSPTEPGVAYWIEPQQQTPPVWASRS